MATLRSGSVSLGGPVSRQTLVIEPEMAGMLVLLPDEQVLSSHQRDDGRIELTIGPKPRRKAAPSLWPWVAFAVAGTAAGAVLAQFGRHLLPF